MAGVADEGGVVFLVAIDAGLHCDIAETLERLHCGDGSVAGGASDLGGMVAGVREDDEVTVLVEAGLRIGPAGCRPGGNGLHGRGDGGFGGVAFVARGCSGPASPLFGFRTGVTLDAGTAQDAVLLVAERDWIGGEGGEAQGSEKATNSSEYLELYLLPPPTAMTTNCFFDFGPA